MNGDGTAAGAPAGGQTAATQPPVGRDLLPETGRNEAPPPAGGQSTMDTPAVKLEEHLTQPYLSSPECEADANPNAAEAASAKEEATKSKDDNSITPLSHGQIVKAHGEGIEVGIIDDKDLDKIRKGMINSFHSSQTKVHVCYSNQFQNAKKFDWIQLDEGRIVEAKHVTETEEDVSALQVQIPQEDAHNYNWNNRPYEQGGTTAMDVDPGSGADNDGFDAAELEAAIKASMEQAGIGSGGGGVGFAEDVRESAPSPTGANPNAGPRKKGKQGLSLRWEDQKQQSQQAPSFSVRDLSKLKFDLVLIEQPTLEEKNQGPTAPVPPNAKAFSFPQPTGPAPPNTDVPEPVAPPASEDEDLADDEAEYRSPAGSSVGADAGDEVRAPPSPREMLRAHQARRKLNQGGVQPDFLTPDSGKFYNAGSGPVGGVSSSQRFWRRSPEETEEMWRKLRKKKVLDANDHKQADLYIP